MTIICDSREQKWEHVKAAFDRAGVKWLRSKLPCGDYSRMDRMSLVIDRKQSLGEVENNLVHDHERFRRECELARDNGIMLIVLVESRRVRDISGVAAWENPRRARWNKLNEAHSLGKRLSEKIPVRPPLSGEQLQKIMLTMTDKYGVQWRFCLHQDTGRAICALLEGQAQWDRTATAASFVSVSP